MNTKHIFSILTLICVMQMHGMEPRQQLFIKNQTSFVLYCRRLLWEKGRNRSEIGEPVAPSSEKWGMPGFSNLSNDTIAELKISFSTKIIHPSTDSVPYNAFDDFDVIIYPRSDDPRDIEYRVRPRGALTKGIPTGE